MIQMGEANFLNITQNAPRISSSPWHLALTLGYINKQQRCSPLAGIRKDFDSFQRTEAPFERIQHSIESCHALRS